MGGAKRMEVQNDRDRLKQSGSVMFPFVCPNCGNSWSLHEEELNGISRSQSLRCRDCGKVFNFLDGVNAFIMPDNIFLQYQIRSNHAVFGKVKISIGQMHRVFLRGEFSRIHRVFLTPECTVPFWCEPLIHGNSGFLVISSKDKRSQPPDTVEVSYLVFGNKHEFETPLWRELLSDAKGHEMNGSYRAAVVELETCFEVFLVDYIKPKLTERFSDKIVEKLFQDLRRIEDRTNLAFALATGKTLKETLSDAGRAGLYADWSNKVKEKRDRIVHRGEKAKSEEARSAFEVVFKIIACLCPASLKYLACTSRVSVRSH